jgi:hypothetical protein
MDGKRQLLAVAAYLDGKPLIFLSGKRQARKEAARATSFISPRPSMPSQESQCKAPPMETQLLGFMCPL